MWFTDKKKLEECVRIQGETIATLCEALDQAMSTVKIMSPYLDETGELRDRVAFQERIDEVLRLELRLVKANLLMRDLKPDISALERLYLLDDPRS